MVSTVAHALAPNKTWETEFSTVFNNFTIGNRARPLNDWGTK